jgi:hypothetical protein
LLESLELPLVANYIQQQNIPQVQITEHLANAVEIYAANKNIDESNDC